MKLEASAGSDDDDDIVTASRIAKRYKTSKSNIYLWAKKRKIPSISFEGIVRFSLSAVKAAIEGPDSDHRDQPE